MLGPGFECHLFVAFLLLAKGIHTDEEISASLTAVPPSMYQWMDGHDLTGYITNTSVTRRDVRLGGRGQQPSLTRELQARKHSGDN